MNSEEEILLEERWKKGDESALKSLVDSFRRPVFSFIFYVSGCDRDTAYGVSVESFVSTARRAADVSRGSFHADVLKNAVALCRKVSPTAFQDVSQFMNKPPSSAVILRVIQQALAGLGFEPRALLLLRDQLNLSFEEIASILDLSAKEVRFKMLTARIQLRNQVEERLGQLEKQT